MNSTKMHILHRRVFRRRLYFTLSVLYIRYISLLFTTEVPNLYLMFVPTYVSTLFMHYAYNLHDLLVRCRCAVSVHNFSILLLCYIRLSAIVGIGIWISDHHQDNADLIHVL